MNKETVKIKYFAKDITPIAENPKGDWVDLRAAEDVLLEAGEFKFIPLGVGMILPEGYEALIAPRSSTFKNFGIIIVNSPGVVDSSFSGDGDQWHCAAYALRDTEIHKNDRICQFRIQKKQPDLQFQKVEKLNPVDRQGFGSTGVN